MESGTAIQEAIAGVETQLTGLVGDITPVVLSVLGAGLAIFAIFMIFRLGKKAIKAGTN